mmetsp:Transcript_28547/g.55879  ORF Transcript_28547/g.55879 Transcript_28547/m.55879 type:complete len:379 (-) Transcript_28547:82-1218(-)
MGRKKRPAEDTGLEDLADVSSKGGKEEDSSEDERGNGEPQHYDIDADIQELAYSFNIDPGLTQRLNDIMIEKRHRTWEQDLARLYEILKDARSPAAMLNLKIRDMEKGTFVGKAQCQASVRALCQKHRLDKGASTKLEEAMSMREAMGKDVEKDLYMLDEHLQASNAPSKLISMKLDSLRKGYNIGHCIYSREPVPGNQGPGVDGVFDKRSGKRGLGYTDADLDRRFQESEFGGGAGQLMDEATVRRLLAAERKQHEAKLSHVAASSRSWSASRSKRRKARRSRGRSLSARRKRSSSCSRSPRRRQSHARSSSPKRKQSNSRGAKGNSENYRHKQKQSRSRRRSCSEHRSRSRRRARAESSSASSERRGARDKKKQKK